ncbi:hypothetical protein AJ79_04384 [Helicocarpus griseus UAMH5409]|uniref:Uncharacterized protein n=1 Tax=Helicocarpus griseus UAMH5409 TaxID=1447875 RepID=A0A2B7XUQ5_9EURO|nr:hypothetical protein AJ79_04384 [Helicocarpus griseus UAMH5409]
MALQGPPISTESLLSEHQEFNNPHTFELSDRRSSVPFNYQDAGYHLPRFYARALVAIFVPVTVTVFYFAIWGAVAKRDDSLIRYGLPGEVWLYYSWFIVGVFGLNLSRYALLGVEAAMLQERFWHANDAMGLIMHCGASWSGPGGWVTGLKRFWKKDKRIAHRLWFTLALLSLLPSAALPLSGLTLELSDGYVKLSEPPMVVGRTFDNFNDRTAIEALNRAINSWKDGSPTTLPGIGIGYTPPHVDRTEHPYLASLPNSLPLGTGISDVFLAPQARVPIDGKAWGVRIGYNCSTVKSASELTILNQKPASKFFNGFEEWHTAIEDANPFLVLNTPTNNAIYIYNSSTTRSENLFGYVEIGAKQPETYDESYSPTTESGVPKTEILEYVVWQVHQFGKMPKDLKFNSAINTPIAGLSQPVNWEPDGEFSTNETFLSISDSDGKSIPYGLVRPLDTTNEPPPEGIQPVAPPIGVRCVRTSAFGHAEISAKGTYNSFEQSPSPPVHGASRAPIFGQVSLQTLWGRYLEHFRATHSPLPASSDGSSYYTGFIQAETLLQSISQAHAIEALQLMYDGAMYSDQAAYLLSGATSSRKDKVINLGTIPPMIPGMLFAIWAVGSGTLGCFYGFRRRWSEVLDGYSMFRFGADYADKICDQPQFPSIKQFDECDALRGLPGLVGDSRMEEEIGHISLVRRGNFADKRKLYI